MPTTPQTERLLSEFPVSSYEEWRAEAEELLDGEPFEKKLISTTYEGIALQPIYWPQDIAGMPQASSYPGFAPFVRGSHAAGYKKETWNVAQEMIVTTPVETNAALRHELECGLTTINLRIHSTSLQDLRVLFDNIDLERTPIMIQAEHAAVSVIALFAELFRSRQLSAANMRGCIGLDPLGLLAISGTLPYSLAEAYTRMAAATKWANASAPRLKTIIVDAASYQNSGGSATQEIACAVATGVEYLREMIQSGLSVDSAAAHLQFGFSIGGSYFMEIAKLRAARLVWAKIMAAFGAAEQVQKMAIHLTTTRWNKSVCDPYVNLLRATVEAFAGIVGGCESLSVGAFDEVARTPDEFSRRIARNTQIILKDEAHVNEVIDPAGGAWYVEKLTDDVARSAWKLFQEIERLGGMTKALQTGFIQQQIRQTAAARAANLGSRRDVLVGVNMYANPAEERLQARPAERTISAAPSLPPLPERAGKELMAWAREAAAAGASSDQIEAALLPQMSPENLPQIEPLRPQRGAAMFEELRAAMDELTAKRGARPTAFLANMGTIAQHKARADFSTGFLEVAGFQILSNPGFANAAEAADAALASNAPLVVICSTDDTYPDLVPPLTHRVKAAKPDTLVVLAGYPKDHVDAFKQAGVDEFIHIRANVCDTLKNILQRIGHPQSSSGA